MILNLVSSQENTLLVIILE